MNKRDNRVNKRDNIMMIKDAEITNSKDWYKLESETRTYKQFKWLIERIHKISDDILFVNFNYEAEVLLLVLSDNKVIEININYFGGDVYFTTKGETEVNRSLLFDIVEVLKTELWNHLYSRY